MGEIIIPERILLNTLRNVLKLVRDDYASKLDKTKSLLYRILGTINLDRYKLFDQAKSVLIGANDDPRFLEVQLFFKLTRAGLPTIHITLPSENSEPGGIGIDEGFQEHEEGDDEDSYRTVLSRRFGSTYNIVITSDNTNEVVLIYHFVRALMIPLMDHLNASGLEQCRISGGDLNIDPRLVPVNIFVRNINLSFSYDVNVVKFFDETTISELIFSAIMLDPDDDDSSMSGMISGEVDNTFVRANILSRIVQNEIITGINGTQTLFTLDYNYLTGSTMVYKNGQRLTIDVDYTEVAPNKLQFTTVPLIIDVLMADYMKVN